MESMNENELRDIIIRCLDAGQQVGWYFDGLTRKKVRHHLVNEFGITQDTMSAKKQFINAEIGNYIATTNVEAGVILEPSTPETFEPPMTPANLDAPHTPGTFIPGARTPGGYFTPARTPAPVLPFTDPMDHRINDDSIPDIGEQVQGRSHQEEISTASLAESSVTETHSYTESNASSITHSATHLVQDRGPEGVEERSSMEEGKRSLKKHDSNESGASSAKRIKVDGEFLDEGEEVGDGTEKNMIMFPQNNIKTLRDLFDNMSSEVQFQIPNILQPNDEKMNIPVTLKKDERDFESLLDYTWTGFIPSFNMKIIDTNETNLNDKMKEGHIKKEIKKETTQEKDMPGSSHDSDEDSVQIIKEKKAKKPQKIVKCRGYVKFTILDSDEEDDSSKKKEDADDSDDDE